MRLKKKTNKNKTDSTMTLCLHILVSSGQDHSINSRYSFFIHSCVFPTKHLNQNLCHSGKSLTSLVGDRYCSMRMSDSCSTMGSGLVQPSDSCVICTPRARALWGRCRFESMEGMLGTHQHFPSLSVMLKAHFVAHCVP